MFKDKSLRLNCVALLGVIVEMWAEQFGMIDTCMFYVFSIVVFVIVLLALVAMFAGFCLQDLS